MPATPLLYAESSFSRPLSLPTFLIFPSGAFLRAPLLPLTLPFSDSTSAGEMASEMKKTSLGLLQGTFQRLTGIEPASQPWEGRILPMNYNRVSQPCQYTISIRPRQQLLYLSPMCHGQQTEGGQFPPSGRAVWEIRNVGCTPLPGPVQQQYRQGIRHSRAASWLLFPDQPQKEMGRCFFADCRPLREVLGFHDSVIAKCNLKNVEFYRFPGQDLCDSHLCRGCHPPILLSAVNFRQNGYCPCQNIREQNSDSVLCTVNPQSGNCRSANIKS